MNRNFRLLTPFFTISLASCNGSGAPSCSDRDVLNTALDLEIKALPPTFDAKLRASGFVNIRTTGRDDGLRKVTCVGDLGEFHDVEYSAQYTDEGKIYVTAY
jgi:hypothetical protein